MERRKMVRLGAVRARPPHQLLLLMVHPPDYAVWQLPVVAPHPLIPNQVQVLKTMPEVQYWIHLLREKGEATWVFAFDHQRGNVWEVLPVALPPFPLPR